jgi:plastocyanin
MKRLLILPVASLAAVLVAGVAGAGTQTVQITANGFTPQSATVNSGDTVTWHNADSANHQIVANNGSFASPILHADQSYSHTFSSAGTFRYHDADSSHAGVITVTGPGPSLTVSASTPSVVYGSSATLSGTTSAGASSQPVTLSAQAYGKSAQSLDQVSTTSGGDYQFSVSPTIATTYQTHWRTADSQTVSVSVAPRIGFSRSGNLFIAKATSDLSYAGHFVWVQRHTVYGWHSLKRIYLNGSSRAVFRVALPKGRSSLRLVMTSGQVGAGYVAGVSRTVLVTHR